MTNTTLRVRCRNTIRIEIVFYFILVYFFFTFLRFLLSDDSRYTHPAAFHRRGEGVL